MNAMNLSEQLDLQQHYGDTLPVAIIAAGCRMPRAVDIFDYWRRLADGEALIGRFEASDPALRARPDYVGAAAVLDDVERFDWSFFGYSQQEAQLIDPQQRLFLMCAWEALEMAGYGPQALADDPRRPCVGVLGACKLSTYSAAHFDRVQDIASPLTFARLMGNDKDYLATRVSYKLGLRGPSLTVQTACSSSLVAVHLACEQLASGECDMVLAGGAGIGFPQQAGYLHRPGMIFSADGLCRPFDAQADGTAIGNGVGVVLLKRLDAALADGDPILAVLRGSAVNNDGASKAGYTAPSPEGQAQVIGQALHLADVAPASIGLVEAHGTATPLGDPIEVQALCRAWQAGPTSPWCALGSVKGNLGHLDTAAGVASLLKAALALHHGQIPPSLNFDQPNPAIDFAHSPFYVPQMLLPWPAGDGPRRAAVSAFAIGGTNCHAILEQAPALAFEPMPGLALLLLSARSEQALAELARRHAQCLEDSQGDLHDYAATSVHHRSLYPRRLLLVGESRQALVDALQDFADGQLEAFTQHEAAAIGVWQRGAADPALLELALAEAPAWHHHALAARRPRQRALLPTAPFEGQRCWYNAPVASPVAAPVPADDWQALNAAAAQAAEQQGAALDLSGLALEQRGVDALHSAYVGQAFAALGVCTAPGQWLDVDQCLAQAGAAPGLRGLFARLLRDLAGAGLLDAQGGRYANLRQAQLPAPGPWLSTMRELGYEQLAVLVERTGPRLADMLAGRVDPVSVVFPGAATDDVEHMYQEQPWSRYLNQIAAAAVHGLASRGRPLRILEVGGGTGGTTRDVLAQLPEGSCSEYWFTDVGPLFLGRARHKFAAVPFMRYQAFDMNQPAAEQGLPTGFDLIIAANVLHNAPNLRTVLANLATRLAPGGHLLMREIIEPKKLFDFVFGPLVPPLDPADGRQGELFASFAQWQAAATAAGFQRCDGYPGTQLASHALGEQIILAQWPQQAQAAVPEPVMHSVVQTLEQPSPGTVLGWLVRTVGRPADTCLQALHWHLDPASLPAPLHLRLEPDSHLLQVSARHAEGQWQPLLSARLQQPRNLRRQVSQARQALAGSADDSLLDRLLARLALDAQDLHSLHWRQDQAAPAQAWLQTEPQQACAADADGRVWLALEHGPRRFPAAAQWPDQGSLYAWHWQPLETPRGSTARRLLWLGEQADLNGFARHGVQVDVSACSDLGSLPLADYDAVCLASGSLPALLQQLAGLAQRPALAVLRRDCFVVTPDDTAENWADAGDAGLLAVAVQELAPLHACLLDSDTPVAAETLLGLLAAPQPADLRVLALRAGQLYQRQLQAVPLPATPMRPEGRHVLIGGLCELGLAVAAWLADQGADDLVILARRAPAADEQRRLDRLRARGVQVEVDSQADVLDTQAFDAALQRLARGPKLGWVVHLAGVLHDAPLRQYDAAHWARCLDSKLLPALALDRHQAQLAPALTLYFSSAASVLGPQGQGAHAWANARLEALASQRNARGHDTLALAWGLWGEIGQPQRAPLVAQLAERGMLGLSTAQGLALLGAATGSANAMLMPARLDWARITQASATARRFAGLSRETPAQPSPAPAQPSAAPASPALPERLRQLIASIAGCAPEAIAADTRLIQLGLDSLLLLDLAERIEQQFGVRLGAQALYEADTLQALCAQLGDAAAPASTVADDLRARLAALLQCPASDIQAHTPLAQLGLDSLLLLELCETLKRDLGVLLSAQEAFEFTTFERFANGLERRLKPTAEAAPASAWAPLRQGLEQLQARGGQWLAANGDALAQADDDAPLTGLRARRQALDDLPALLYVEYDKPASFDLGAFEQAWNRLLARHPMTRAHLDRHGRLRLAPDDARLVIALDDWRDRPASERDLALATRRAQWSREPAAVSGLPLQWHASRLDHGTLRLHLRMDTALIDIESVRVILRETYLWLSEPQRTLPTLHFSARDYFTCEQALTDTDACTGQLLAYRQGTASCPPPLALAASGAGPASYRIWRAALPRERWLALKQRGLQANLPASAVLAAVYAAALLPLGQGQAFALRLDYPDRKPLHAEVMNLVLDASDLALLPCDPARPSFAALARDCASALEQRLAACLVTPAQVLDAHGLAALPTVAMTSLLGVRTTYAIAETSDPLLGMPSYEVASQPGTWLHLQVLEEESALLYNLDLRRDRLDEAVGEAVMGRFEQLLARLVDDPASWDAPLASLAGGAA
ncbi:KR domain-containing protein [Pantoea sp. Ap-967]|nr:KR domain-containing protein [Pantoea sp. Ap-967]